jgi:hypothetical protein
LTYPAIYFIEQLDLKNKVVLEFGSGASTLYFSRRCKSVISYETSRYWYNLFYQKLSPNCLMHFVSKDFWKNVLQHESSDKLNDLFAHDCLHIFEPESGASSTSVYDIILNLKSADVILIDGGPRNTTMSLVAKYCKSGALVIIDNTDAAHNQLGLEFMESSQFLRIPFWGIGPINTWEWETSIYFKAKCDSLNSKWRTLFE